MSGDPASSTLAKNDFKEIREKTEGFEARLGLPHLTEQNECEWLALTGEEISKMTAEACGEAAMDLANYSLYIQRSLNKEKGYLRWLNTKINLAVAEELQSYAGYYSHEQRREVAIMGNAYAKALKELSINSQLKVDILDGLTFQINQLCRVLLEAQTSKRRGTNG